jgi:hypothetical protein
MATRAAPRTTALSPPQSPPEVIKPMLFIFPLISSPPSVSFVIFTNTLREYAYYITLSHERRGQRHFCPSLFTDADALIMRLTDSPISSTLPFIIVGEAMSCE